MLYTEKDKLWSFLKSELSEMKAQLHHDNIELLYQGHGWSNNFLVLCIEDKDYLFKPSGAHIKIYCPDCNFKLTSDGDNVINDVSSKLSVHVCQI